jgi:hypothetical protein
MDFPYPAAPTALRRALQSFRLHRLAGTWRFTLRCGSGNVSTFQDRMYVHFLQYALVRISRTSRHPPCRPSPAFRTCRQSHPDCCSTTLRSHGCIEENSHLRSTMRVDRGRRESRVGTYAGGNAEARTVARNYGSAGVSLRTSGKQFCPESNSPGAELCFAKFCIFCFGCIGSSVARGRTATLSYRSF